MTRWLQAARAAKSAPETHDETDKTDRTLANSGSGKDLSVLSFLSVGYGAKSEGERQSLPRAAVPATEAVRRRAASFPIWPPTCSACGATDWRVAITEPDGRKLHVECWKVEQEAQLERHRGRAKALSDPDGVARSREATEAVWDAAEAQAPLLRAEREMKKPARWLDFNTARRQRGGGE